MRIKFFAGTWDSWGFEISYCPYIKALTIGFIHWYFGFEVWTKEEINRQKERQKEIIELIEQMREEEEAIQNVANKKRTKKK